MEGAQVKDKELAQLFDAYLDDVFSITPMVIPWWSGLLARATGRELNMRWPFGPSGHPLILGVHRKHHAHLVAVRDRRMELAQDVSVRFDDDAAWGKDELPKTNLPPVPPREVLIDWLEQDDPEIHEVMTGIVMPPIGEPPSPLPTLDTLPGRLAQLPAFDPPLLHDVDQGIERLLSAPSDLRTTPMPARTRANSPSHERLFLAYEHQLAVALVEATSWWQGLLEQRRKRKLSPKKVVQNAYEFCIAGPAGHEQVLGVIQTYWVLCEQLNAGLPPVHRVAPETMLLDWLRDGKHESWVRMLAGMPYWPIGIDTDGHWF
jgi:hypothetical protein